MEEVAAVEKRGAKEIIQKQMCALDHTKHMGGVDCSDHYCTTRAFILKSLVVEKNLILVPGSVYCKFIHFVPQPETRDGNEINATC
jgi:hypothetical protein